MMAKATDAEVASKTRQVMELKRESTRAYAAMVSAYSALVAAEAELDKLVYEGSDTKR